jgi:hypothetical protein
VLPQERRLLRHGGAITDEDTEVPVAQRLMKFGVLLLGDCGAASAQQADQLRAIAIPAWTAGTDFEVHWLLQRASVKASVALVDLRGAESDRSDDVERLAALAREAMLPVVVVGAINEEILLFHDVVARLPRTATDEDVATAIDSLKSLVS